MVRIQRGFIAASVIGVALLAGLALPVMAHDGEVDAEEQTTESSDTQTAAEQRRAEALKKLEEKRKALAEKQQALEDKRAEIKERIQGKLEETKKRICEQRVATIEKIMANTGENGTKHLLYFDKALERIQSFYTEKELTVSNYDRLVAAVNTKKAAAQTAIDAVKANTNFTCDGDNPVGSIDAFNGQAKAMHNALKDVRTTLKDLLVAVKTAAEAKEEES